MISHAKGGEVLPEESPAARFICRTARMGECSTANHRPRSADGVSQRASERQRARKCHPERPLSEIHNSKRGLRTLPRFCPPHNVAGECTAKQPPQPTAPEAPPSTRSTRARRARRRPGSSARRGIPARPRSLRARSLCGRRTVPGTRARSAALPRAGRTGRRPAADSRRAQTARVSEACGRLSASSRPGPCRASWTAPRSASARAERRARADRARSRGGCPRA